MQENFAIIRRVKQEHENIRATVKVLSERTSDIDDAYYRERWLRRQISSREESPQSVFTDQDALYRLALAQPDLLPADLRDRTLAELVQNFETVAAGLQRHFAYEEEYVTDIFQRHGSGMFAAVLFAEHGGIRAAVSNLLEMSLGEVWQRGDSEARASLGREFALAVQRLRISIEEHARKEEVVFELFEKALGGGG